MPFSSMLFMKAVTQGLAVIASDLALWRQFFPPAVPTALADGWFTVFAPAGVSAVKVISAYRQGIHRPPVVIVRLGAASEGGTAMGYDSSTDDIEGETDSYRVLRENQTLYITTISPTVEMTAAIHAAVQACVLDNLEFFDLNGIAVIPAGSNEIDPNEEMPQELLGTFMTQGMWNLQESVQYPRLRPNAPVFGALGIARVGERDENDAPGRVQPGIAGPEVLGTLPVDGQPGASPTTLIEVRFSRRMDPTTTFAAFSMTVNDVAVDAADYTIALVDDPPTNVGALRENRLRVRLTEALPALAVVALAIATTALSDTGAALAQAAAWTFIVAG